MCICASNAIDLVFIWGRPCVQLEESKSNLEQHNGMCQVDHSWLFHLPFQARGSGLCASSEGKAKRWYQQFPQVCIHSLSSKRGKFVLSVMKVSQF